MDKDKKAEERKRLNAPFLKAFDWLTKHEALNQKQMAERLDTNSSLISAYRSGLKLASEFIKSRLIIYSINIGKEISIDYLNGKSDYMLIENTPEDEIWRLHVSRDNPDYELMENKNEIDKDEEVNKIIRIYEKEMDELKLYHQRECEAYEATIASQKETILLLKEKIVDLKAELSKLKTEETLQNFPFTPGVAEREKGQIDSL